MFRSASRNSVGAAEPVRLHVFATRRSRHPPPHRRSSWLRSRGNRPPENEQSVPPGELVRDSGLEGGVGPVEAAPAEVTIVLSRQDGGRIAWLDGRVPVESEVDPIPADTSRETLRIAQIGQSVHENGR